MTAVFGSVSEPSQCNVCAKGVRNYAEQPVPSKQSPVEFCATKPFFLSASHFPDGIVKSLVPSLTLFVQPKPQHIGIAKPHKRDARKTYSKRTATSLFAGGSGAEEAGNGVG